MKKLLGILLILALAAGMLTACGDEKKQETAPAGGTDAPAQAAEDAVISAPGTASDAAAAGDETEAPAEKAVPAVHHAAAVKYADAGMIVHAGSADGTRLLATQRTDGTFGMGIYSVSGEKLCGISMDDTAKEMIIFAAGNSRGRYERDKAKREAYMADLQEMDDAELLQAYLMTEGNVITRVFSVRNDIAMCECCRSFPATVDLQTGEMRLAYSQYQYPDGSDVTAEEITEDDIPGSVIPALPAAVVQSGVMRDAYFPSADEVYILSVTYGADLKMTYDLTFANTEGKREHLCEITLDGRESYLTPLRIFVSGSGAVFLPCSTMGGGYVILPGEHEAKFLTADTESMKLFYGEPSGPGYLITYGFLPDGCLLCYALSLNCLISVDPVTLDYQPLYINAGTGQDSGIDFMNASLFGNTLYLPKVMCIRVD